MTLYNRIKSIKNSKDGKRLAENFVSLTLLQICSYIFPILTFPYLTRILGVEYFGAIAFASVVVSYFQTFIDWGFFLISTREIAKNRDNKQIVNRIFSITTYSKLILLALGIVLLVILTLLVPIFREKIILIWLTFLIIPGHIFFPEWFFQGLERMKYLTLLNFVIKLTFTGLVFVFITKPEDYLYQPILISLGYIVAAVIAMYIILFRWKYSFVKVSIKECITSIKECSDVFINTLMPNLYNSFSVILLGFWGGNTANGILEGGSKFVTISYNFLQVISRVFFHFLARKIEKHSLYVKINIGCSSFIAITLFIFAPQLVSLFLTDEFSNSIVVLRILAPSLIFTSLSSAYGANYLILQGREQLARNISVISCIIGFICAWILVYCYSWLGAALAMLIGRVLLGTGQFLGAMIVKNTAKLK